MDDKENMDFPTTGTERQDQSKLEEVARKGDANRLTLVQKNRIEGMKGLNKAVDSLENTLEKLPMDTALFQADPDDEVFNLKVALREVLQGLQNSLTSIEASQSLEDMLVHDLAGCIKNLEQIAQANWQTGAHQQVLLEVMKEKGLITEDELREMWNRVIPDAIEKLKEEAKKS